METDAINNYKHARIHTNIGKLIHFINFGNIAIKISIQKCEFASSLIHIKKIDILFLAIISEISAISKQ